MNDVSGTGVKTRFDMLVKLIAGDGEFSAEELTSDSFRSMAQIIREINARRLEQVGNTLLAADERSRWSADWGIDPGQPTEDEYNIAWKDFTTLYICKALTDLHKRVLSWLPIDGSWHSWSGKYGGSPAGKTPMCQLREMQVVECNRSKLTGTRYRLTPLGIRVQNGLEKIKWLTFQNG